jgi:mycothiol system anti-sigma-R factor
MTMIDCREAVARMWAYLAHGLETHDEAELEAHLGACQRCCGELEFSRQLREKVAETGAHRMPAPMRNRIDALLRSAEAGAEEPS